MPACTQWWQAVSASQRGLPPIVSCLTPRRTLLRSAAARPEVRKKSRASLSATRPSPSASATRNQASTTLSGIPSTSASPGLGDVDG